METGNIVTEFITGIIQSILQERVTAVLAFIFTAIIAIVKKTSICNLLLN